MLVLGKEARSFLLFLVSLIPRFFALGTFPVRLPYQPPASSTFISEQTSHQQPANSNLLSEQTSISHQPPAKRTGCLLMHLYPLDYLFLLDLLLTVTIVITRAMYIYASETPTVLLGHITTN
jgi:hypothetical protein